MCSANVVDPWSKYQSENPSSMLMEQAASYILIVKALRVKMPFLYRICYYVRLNYILKT